MSYFTRDAPTQNRDSSIGAVVLAAGAASRIGHRPKCLLELHGEPLLQRLLRALLNGGINHIVVVLGYYAAQIKPIVTNFPTTLVHNPTPDAGQNSSLHCGLRALPPALDTVLVALADQPLLDAGDIDDAVRAYRQRPAIAEVMVPIIGNLPGNPVLFSAAVREAILLRDNTYGGKQWQMENPERVYRWQTMNEHYRVDVDTLDDIDTLKARTGLQLRWPPSN